MRRVVVPLVVALLGLGHAAMGGCSSSSSLAGGGGCDAFCTKWVGARCRNGPTKEKCMETCLDQQTRCRPETNNLLRCATIEAQIACETGSGEPRIVGCGARETALRACLVCDRFCQNWSSLKCPLSPGLEECVTTCLDPRCSAEHLRVTECFSGNDGSCDSEGRPFTSFCGGVYGSAAACTSRYGQPQPFSFIPVEPVDAGADAP